MPVENATWRALAAEAGVASDQLGDGVTLLEKMVPEYSWSFARAFFPLSVGLERACKLALQVDSKLTTGRFLGSREMRDFGHGLDALLEAVDAMAQRRGIEHGFPREPVHQAIVKVLTDFATGGRYHNLDHLTGRRGSDPVQVWWDSVVVPVLEARYPAAIGRRDEAMAQDLGAAVDEGAILMHAHVAGGTMTSMVDFLQAREQLARATPWTRVYVLQLARWLHGCFSCLYPGSSPHGNDVPDIAEFFARFNNDDRFFKSRKTWRL